MSSHPTPLERLRASGVAPERALGQNFLIDPNILGVIERMAALAGGDVVLEVGPGLGVLTERLLEKCRAVHCVEVDRRLAAMLEEEFRERPGFHLHLADAVRLPFAGLDPAPDKFVSNLPYSVAAPLVIKSLEELPSVGLWCLMVQKEIADRLFAAPGSSAYGGVSVMTQLLAEKISSRAVSASVFYPRPRVRSSLVAFRRRRNGTYAGKNFAAVKEIVYAAFRHRRKMLVNGLAGADPPPAALADLGVAARRKLIEEVLGLMGLPPGVRPQALTPPRFEQLAAALAAEAEFRQGEGGHA